MAARLCGADVKYDKNRGDTNGEQCNKTEIRMEKNAIKVGRGIENENLRLKRGKRVNWRYNGYVRFKINS